MIVVCEGVDECAQTESNADGDEVVHLSCQTREVYMVKAGEGETGDGRKNELVEGGDVDRLVPALHFPTCDAFRRLCPLPGRQSTWMLLFSPCACVPGSQGGIYTASDTD